MVGPPGSRLRGANGDRGSFSFEKLGGAELRRLLCVAAARRPRKAEMVAQGRSRIFRPEQTTPLQFRHDQIDEVVEAAREVGRQDDEAVGQPAVEPLLEDVGDPLGLP